MNDAAGSLRWGMDSPLEVAAALLLAAVFVGSVLTARRRLGDYARLRWFGVVVLNATASLAIFALLVPPVLERPAADTITLLTEGASTAPAAITDAYVSPGAGDYGRGPGYLLDIAQLTLKEPALGTLTVTGHGLDAREWQRLPDDLAIRYDPPPLSGLVEIEWRQSLAEGDLLVVEGRYRDDLEEIARFVELTDPAGLPVASHDLLSGDAFALTAQPKAPGLAEYRLRVLGDDGELYAEPVPVYVQSDQRPVLYIMQSAPSFETRQLKNWAGDNTATVVIDTVITRRRELRQRVNAEAVDDDRLSPALLEAAGLAIVDGRAWAGLDAARRDWFEAAVREGMGLLILADGDLAKYLDGSDSLLEGFALTERQRDQDGYAPMWEYSVSEQRLPLLGFELHHRGEGVLTQIESGEIVEAYHTVGLGRVAVSVLRERHRWLTSGDDATYTTYWARLMSRIGRPRPLPYLLAAGHGPLPTRGQRLRLCAMAGSNEVTLDVAPLREDAPLKLDAAAADTGGPRRCAEFWPWRAGWHSVRLYADDAGNAADESFFYVFAEDEWQAHRRDARQRATAERAAASGPDAPLMTRTAGVDISPLWPWLVLMLSAGLLWLERRLF